MRHVFGFNVVPLSKADLAQNVGPKFLGCNRGTISIKRIIGEKMHGRSSGTSYLSNTVLAHERMWKLKSEYVICSGRDDDGSFVSLFSAAFAVPTNQISD